MAYKVDPGGSCERIRSERRFDQIARQAVVVEVPLSKHGAVAVRKPNVYCGFKEPSLESRAINAVSFNGSVISPYRRTCLIDLPRFAELPERVSAADIDG
jgi:hypothetical protein